MLITIKEYAEKHNRNVVNIRQRCLRGSFDTATKIGRNWFIEENEPLTDSCFEIKVLADYKKEKFMLIPLKEYAELHERVYKSVQQKAIRGGFITAQKVGNQWFIDKAEPYLNLNHKSSKTPLNKL